MFMVLFKLCYSYYGWFLGWDRDQKSYKFLLAEDVFISQKEFKCYNLTILKFNLEVTTFVLTVTPHVQYLHKSQH